MEWPLRISDACIGCGQCVKVCIRGHLAIKDKKVVEIESPCGEAPVLLAR